MPTWCGSIEWSFKMWEKIAVGIVWRRWHGKPGVCAWCDDYSNDSIVCELWHLHNRVCGDEATAIDVQWMCSNSNSSLFILVANNYWTVVHRHPLREEEQLAPCPDHPYKKKVVRNFFLMSYSWVSSWVPHEIQNSSWGFSWGIFVPHRFPHEDFSSSWVSSWGIAFHEEIGPLPHEVIMRKPIFHEDLMRLFPRGTWFLMRFTVSNFFFHEEIGPLFNELLMRLFPRGTLIP